MECRPLGKLLAVLMSLILLFGALPGSQPGAQAATTSLPGTGMACFRSLNAIEARLTELVKNYPNLAEIVDIGPSWEKTDGVDSTPGSDLQVLRITNKAITETKPVMFVVSGLDSRDILGVELNLRFAERLLESYGQDPDVTMVLDTSEVQLLLVANPDGREVLESQLATENGAYLTWGEAWGRNRNTAGCTFGTPSIGVDLSRNFALGFTPKPNCVDDYPGPNAESEPETFAIAEGLRELYPDTRSNPTAPVIEDTPGLVINLTDWGTHHFVFYPYHWGDWIYSLAGKLANSPGEDDLMHQAVAEDQTRFGNLLGYAYEELGVASMEMRIMKLGLFGRFPNCSQFTEPVVDAWLDTLLKAARSSPLPYEFAQGPEITSLSATQSTATSSQTWDVKGTVDAWDYQNLFWDKLPADPEGVDYSRSLPPWHESAVTSAAVYTADETSTYLGTFSTPLPDNLDPADEPQLIYFQAYNTDGKFGLPRALFVTPTTPTTPTEMHYLALPLITR